MISGIGKKITGLLLLLFYIGSLSSCINDKQENREHFVRLNAIQDSLDKFDSAISLHRVRDPEFSLKVAEKALKLADHSGDERLKVRSYLLAGIANHQYNPDSAFIYYHKAMDAALQAGIDSIQPRILYNMAMIIKSGYNYQDAIQLLDSAWHIAARLKDFITVSNCLNSLGNIEAELHRDDRARLLFDSAFAVASAHRLGKQTGVAYGSIARFTKDPEEAMRLQRKALEILNPIEGAEEEKGYILINIGEATSDQDSAISFYLQAIETARRGNIPEMEIAACNNLAYSYLDKQNTRLAEIYLAEIAIPLARKAKNHDWLPTLFDSYADVLKAGGNTGKAFEYQKEAYRAREESEIHNAASQTRLLSAILGEKNMKMKILEQESELVSDRSHQKFLYFTILFLLLLIVIFGLAVAGFITRKNLRIKKKELDTARRLALLEEQEKMRLSYQLHDLIRPVRAAILKRSGSADAAGTILSGETLSELDQIYASLRRISHRMNPEMRSRLSFAELVKEIREDFAITSLHEINLSLEPEQLELTAECAGHFYFIITELLANADKHIARGKVSIRISAELDHLYLFYNDNGPGFDIARGTIKGLGIRNIHERARLLGGHADLSSAPNSGTEWIISIPAKGNILPEKP